MDKIKEFLKSKVVQIIAWCLLFVCAAVLIYNGISVENMSNGLVLFMGILTAISAVIVFVRKMLK